jgi:hypothetical protein
MGARGRLLALSVEASTGVPRCPSTHRVLVGWDGTAAFVRAPLAVEESAEAIVTGGIAGRREGPNAKPSARTFVLVIVALIAANPSGGLAGKV